MAADPIEVSQLGIEEARRLPSGSRHYRAYVGPPAQYDFMGATQFRLLTALGLREDHFVLDIGCGSLRAGRLLLQYLLPERYHGIEPNDWLVREAISKEIGSDLIGIKKPVFSSNSDFDYSVFGRTFDYIVAQSIFSHTAPDLARSALGPLRRVMHDASLALATFIEATPRQPAKPESGWVYPGVVRFDTVSIVAMIEEAGLVCQRLSWFHPRQTWFLLATRAEALLTHVEIGALGGGAVLRDDRF